MIRFPISASAASSAQSVKSWNQELRDSMGACWRVRPPCATDPAVSYRIMPIGDMSIMGISVSSPITYGSAPRESSTGSDRLFFIHMGNAPNRMNMFGHLVLQRPGEIMLGDSAIRTTSACDTPHSTLCAGIPAERFREYLPEPERFVGKHLDTSSTYARIVATLLAALYRMAATGVDESDGRSVETEFLRAFAKWCALSSSGAPNKLRSEQVKRLINAEIRNPALSVESIADKIGVSTRYLQLLFAHEEDCVSRYIRRERLRGCLLDLCDSDCSDKSITDIAFSWGFNSASHFSSSFRKEYGLAARDYRTCAPRELAGSLRNGVARALALASERRVS
jgi:AraC-like DNA-binding protein